MILAVLCFGLDTLVFNPWGVGQQQLDSRSVAGQMQFFGPNEAIVMKMEVLRPLYMGNVITYNPYK